MQTITRAPKLTPAFALFTAAVAAVAATFGIARVIACKAGRNCYYVNYMDAEGYNSATDASRSRRIALFRLENALINDHLYLTQS